MIGRATPRLVLYLPHRPKAFVELTQTPCVETLLSNNSNHWRKIITILAKVCGPDCDDWRSFRDKVLFDDSALSSASNLHANLKSTWHWVGGKENLQRFTGLEHSALPLKDCKQVSIDPAKRLLLTPYPDYRQLNNSTISAIRTTLSSYGFYDT